MLPLSEHELAEKHRIVAELIAYARALLADPVLCKIFSHVGTSGDFSDDEQALLDADLKFNATWKRIVGPLPVDPAVLPATVADILVNTDNYSRGYQYFKACLGVSRALARRMAVSKIKPDDDRSVFAYVANRTSLLHAVPHKVYSDRVENYPIAFDDLIEMFREIAASPEYWDYIERRKNYKFDPHSIVSQDDQVEIAEGTITHLSRRVDRKFGYFSSNIRNCASLTAYLQERGVSLDDVAAVRSALLELRYYYLIEGLQS